MTNDEVIWSDFLQPHRPDRNYAKFGPFKFSRTQYETSTARLDRDLDD